MQIAEELAIKIIEGKIKTPKELDAAKKKASKGIFQGSIRNSDILEHIPKQKRTKEILQLLMIRKTRSRSGIAVVAVMTRPKKCPKKEPCIYCPGGEAISTPQSYIGKEPAAMRGLQFNFSPFEQAKYRLNQLKQIGHSTEKVELVIMGGTFTAEDEAYQEQFVKGCFDALNESVSNSLEEAKKINETAKQRCIGMVIETRPEWCFEPQIEKMLHWGATRVELGVQHPDNKIYELVKREHTVEDVVKSTALLKDSAFKIAYHIMPGLPGSSPQKDITMFKKIFEEDEFKPDMLKIYPCLLVKPEFLQKKEESEIYQMYKRGEWIPYNDEKATEVIAEAKKYFPRWVRIMRIERDIPTNYILAGVKASNLRELIHNKLKSEKKKCNCIRCREIGFVDSPDLNNLHLKTEEYNASKGKELFMSFDDVSNDSIAGFLRLRFPFAPFMPQLNKETALVRELHIYGTALKIGEKQETAAQHRGLGQKLLENAEKIAIENGFKKMAIISGVGVREYYRRLGYELDGNYMCKNLKQ